MVPTDLVGSFAASRSVTSRHPPLLEQAVLCDFITEGHFGSPPPADARGLRRALSVLLESARESLAGMLEISSVEAGLQTAGWLREGIDGGVRGEGAARAGLR